MDSGSVARRYAKALFGLAVERGRVEAWSDALGSLAKVLKGAPDLAETLANPVHTRDERRRPRAEARRGPAARAGAREPPAPPRRPKSPRPAPRTCSARFGELADAHLGRLRARLTSAVALDPGRADALAGRLSDMTRATVLLERSVEPALLGGVVAQVGSLVYDGSVRTQLDDLRSP